MSTQTAQSVICICLRRRRSCATGANHFAEASVNGIKGCGAFGRSLRDRLRGSMKRIRWGQAKLIETPGLGPELPIEVRHRVHKPGTGAVQGLANE
jgi:hypothetical protein